MADNFIRITNHEFLKLENIFYFPDKGNNYRTRGFVCYSANSE